MALDVLKPKLLIEERVTSEEVARAVVRSEGLVGDCGRTATDLTQVACQPLGPAATRAQEEGDHDVSFDVSAPGRAVVDTNRTGRTR